MARANKSKKPRSKRVSGRLLDPLEVAWLETKIAEIFSTKGDFYAAYKTATGRSQDPERQLQRILNSEDPITPPVRINFAKTLGMTIEDFDVGLRESLGASRPCAADRTAEMRAKLKQAQDLEARHENDEAQKLLREVQYAAEEAGAKTERAEALLGLVGIALNRRDLGEGEQLLKKAEVALSRVRDKWLHGVFFRQKAFLLERQKKTKEAEAILQKAVELVDDKDKDARAQGFWSATQLVHFYCEDKRFDEAEKNLHVCSKHLSSVEMNKMLRRLYHEAAIHLAICGGQIEQVKRHAAEVSTEASSKHLAQEAGGMLQNLSNRARHLKAFEAGLACAEAAAELGLRAERHDLHTVARYTTAALCFDQGSLDEAKRICLSILDEARGAKDGKLLQAVSQLLSVVARRQGDADSAVRSAETALSMAGDEPEGVCMAKLTLADALFDAGRVREAFDHAKAAFDVARSAKAPPQILIEALSVILDSGALLGEWTTIDEFTKHFKAVPIRTKDDEARRNQLLEQLKGQRELRQRFESYAKDNQPLKTAATEGSITVQAANGQVLHPLLDWWREIPEAAAELYDLWGRGNFARLLLSMKAFPHAFNVSIEVRTLDDVRSAIRLWSLFTDVLILLWKGEMRNGLGIVPFPGDYAGPGGWGYAVCAGSKLDRKPTHTRTWYPAMGWGSILPAAVANFLATEAKPLLEQGRLLLVPAAAIGCFHPSHGPLENLFSEICNAVPCVKGNNSPNPIGLLPYFPDVPIAALADVIGEHNQTLAKLRLLLIRQSRELRLHGDPQAAMKELELEIQDALASLRDLEASLSRKKGWAKRDEPLAGSRFDFTRQQMFQAAFESEGSRPLVSLSAMLGGLERQVWSPVLMIESMGYGWRVASASATQPRKRYQPEEGEAIGAWLCPPTPGWSMPTAIRIPEQHGA
jgi:tetratricopeptide (TPR) repeat protein